MEFVFIQTSPLPPSKGGDVTGNIHEYYTCISYQIYWI